MNEELKNIIKEEFDKVMSNNYSEDDIKSAILKKNFIHTNQGVVYCPVKLEKGHVVGVNDDYEHVNIAISEVSLIENKEERFGK
jgi:hypothetical protein